MALTPSDLVIVAGIEEKLILVATSMRYNAVNLKQYKESLDSIGNIYTKDGVETANNYIKTINSLNAEVSILNDFITDLWFFVDKSLL